MPISSLFAGMEAYLDGDVEINNNVGAPDDAAEDAEIADQTAAEAARVFGNFVTAKPAND